MTYIDPQDIDPDTGRPYANYSSPALDTSFHDGEMDVDTPAYEVVLYNSSRCELDRKVGGDLGTLLREMADEGCIGGGDEIHIIDHTDDDA